MAFLEDEDDMRAFEASLNFVEEYANDSVHPPGLPSLPDSSDASSSLAFRLSDALPSQFLGTGGSTTETSMTMPLSVAEQLSGYQGAGFHIGTSTVAPSQASTQRKSIRPRKAQSNPNRARNELRFELAYLREKVTQLEQELSVLQLKPRVKMLRDGQETQDTTIMSTSSSPHVVCAWKGVASRQRQRREGAERENARLRLIVDRQRKVAVDLSDLLRKRMAETTHVSDPHYGSYASERRLCKERSFMPSPVVPNSHH